MGPRRSAARSRRHTGTVLILIAVVIVVLVGLGALAIDGSHIHEIRTQCQATADSAALAAASMLPDQAAGRSQAKAYGGKNMSPSVHGAVITDSDVTFGSWDFSTKVFTRTSAPSSINAVKVTAHRTTAGANALDLTLARAMGFQTADVASTAIAAFSAGKPWDIALLQDVTSSFSEELGQAIKADHKLLDCFKSIAPPQSLFGVATFTGWGKVNAPLTAIGPGYSALKGFVAGIKKCGSAGAPVCSGTDIAAGLKTAVNMLVAAPGAPGLSKAVVMLTDGQPEPNANGSHPTSNAAQLKTLATQWANNAGAAGISVFVVFYDGDNNPTAKAFLQTLVRGEGIFLSTPDPDKIPDLFATICGQFTKLHLVH